MPPRRHILTGLVLVLVLVLSLSCSPDPQPEALTPIPTLAPAATLIPALEEPVVSGGEAVPSPEPEAGDPASGAEIFGQKCASCHGEGAEGGVVGPTLISAEMKAKDDDHYREVIINGIPGTAMPIWEGRLSAKDIEDVIAFLRSKQ